MGKYIIDFIFDEKTGETKILIEFYDEAMSALEMNEAIRSGELKEKAIDLAQTMFGKEIAEKVTSGKIELVCLDHHPELKPDTTAIPIAQQIPQKKNPLSN